MTYNDYVILVDENGTPYIAHGERYQQFRNNLKNSRPVKYLQKFPNFYGMGKTAYAYTEQQLRNLRAGGRRAASAVKNTATKAAGSAKNTAKRAAKYLDDHDAGLSEAIGARAAQRRVDRANRRGDTETAEKNARKAYRLREQSRREYNRSGVKKAADTIEKYGSTSLAAIRRTGQNAIDRMNTEGAKVGELAKRAGHTVKTAGRRVGQFVDDHDMGITERIQANRMSKRARELETKGKGRLHLDAEPGENRMAAQLDREAGRLRAQARQEYENSVVGKAGNSIKNMGKSASTALAAKTADISNAIDQISGKAAKREYEKAFEEANMATRKLVQAEQNYNNTSPGRGNNIGAQMRTEKELQAAEEEYIAAITNLREIGNQYRNSPYGLFDSVMEQIEALEEEYQENRRVKNALKKGETSGR